MEEEEKPLTPEQIQHIEEMNKAILKGTKEFKKTLRKITDETIGIPSVAKKTKLGRNSLYKILGDEDQKTKMSSIFDIINALGFRFKIKNKDLE